MLGVPRAPRRPRTTSRPSSPSKPQTPSSPDGAARNTGPSSPPPGRRRSAQLPGSQASPRRSVPISATVELLEAATTASDSGTSPRLARRARVHANSGVASTTARGTSTRAAKASSFRTKVSEISRSSAFATRNSRSSERAEPASRTRTPHVERGRRAARPLAIAAMGPARASTLLPLSSNGGARRLARAQPARRRARARPRRESRSRPPAPRSRPRAPPPRLPRDRVRLARSRLAAPSLRPARRASSRALRRRHRCGRGYARSGAPVPLTTLRRSRTSSPLQSAQELALAREDSVIASCEPRSSDGRSSW